MRENILFEPYKLGNIELKNRIVMSPMTRSRAIGNIPNDLMAKYYEQRAGAGLIVTEGTSPSPNGLGYARIPGIFNEEQVSGWKKVTEAVHTKKGKIFIQLMHTGRVGHPLNLPAGAKILSPSGVKANGQIRTDTDGLKDFPEPKAMTFEEVQHTIDEYITSANNAIRAGFDGVELHGANGYLLEQFLSPFSNIRTDVYSGNIENRSRFILEVVTGISNSIGKDKIGIRLSPYGVSNSMQHYPEIDETYKYLTEQLNKIGINYIHIVDHSSMGAPEVPSSIKNAIRERFKNTLILSGGFTKEKAEESIQNGLADLVAFGKPFINNPDLVDRFVYNWPLANHLDPSTFYTIGEKGYTDYEFYKSKN